MRRILHAEEDMRKAAFACLKRIDLNKRIRLVGVRTSNLKKSVIDSVDQQ